MPPKRWPSLSASANADWEYRVLAADHTTAHNYVCICQLPFGDEEEDDDEEEDEDEQDGETDATKEKKTPCGGGKACLWDERAADHPDHPWKMTVAGKRKFLTHIIMCSLRHPDTFGVYTFNDHFGYDILEVIQNILLDYEEAVDS